MSLYYLPNARDDRQRDYMRRLDGDSVCLFCPDGMAGSAQQIAHSTDHWTITPNEYPYAGARLHLLLVPRQHVVDMLDLPAEAQQDFWAALSWVRAAHGLDHYGLAVRNGDSRYTGGTIRHLHVHVVVGDPAGPPVKVKLSSRPG